VHIDPIGKCGEERRDCSARLWKELIVVQNIQRESRFIFAAFIDIGGRMIDDSLTIRNEAMTARERGTIFVASTGGALMVRTGREGGMFEANHESLLQERK
jgi:hypothetical protein